MTGDEKAGWGEAQFSATDILKKRTIDYIFSLCQMVTTKEETVSQNTYETGLVRGVRMAKSLLWKYVPDEIRKPIRDLYKTMDLELNRIDADTALNEDVKMLNKRKIADSLSLQVLEFLLVVLLYSPMAIEFKDAEIFGDFEELIKTIRRDEPVKLFSGELKNVD